MARPGILAIGLAISYVLLIAGCISSVAVKDIRQVRLWLGHVLQYYCISHGMFTPPMRLYVQKIDFEALFCYILTG